MTAPAAAVGRGLALLALRRTRRGRRKPTLGADGPTRAISEQDHVPRPDAQTQCRRTSCRGRTPGPTAKNRAVGPVRQGTLVPPLHRARRGAVPAAPDTVVAQGAPEASARPQRCAVRLVPARVSGHHAVATTTWTCQQYMHRCASTAPHRQNLQHLENSWPNSACSTKAFSIGATSVKCWPTLANFLPTFVKQWPASTVLRPVWSTLGHIWASQASLGKHWPTTGNFGEHRANFGLRWANFGRSRSASAVVLHRPKEAEKLCCKWWAQFCGPLSGRVRGL